MSGQNGVTPSASAARTGHNLRTIRESNRSTVLRLLHRRGGLSRREIAHQTGLNDSTISHIIGEFLAAGLVRERGPRPADAQPRSGRRQIGLELLPTAVYALGAHLGVGAVRVAACDLSGQVVARRVTTLDPGAEPGAVVAAIAHLAGDIARSEPVRGRRLVGLGVGAIAFLDPTAGVIQSAPSLGVRWVAVAITDPLSEHLGLPVLLDHHVRAMAAAEQWFGLAHDLLNFALVNVDTSIGVGIVVNGQLVRGDNARAGQIAHLVVAEDGPPCACGRRGCLVMLASYRALAARAAELVRQQPAAPLAQAASANAALALDQLVFTLAAQGDPASRRLIDEMAGHLARSVTHLIALLDPHLIVLSAGGSGHAALLLEHIQPRVAAQAPLIQNGAPPRITASALDRDLAVLGGAALALEHFVAGPLTGAPARSRIG